MATGVSTVNGQQVYTDSSGVVHQFLGAWNQNTIYNNTATSNTTQTSNPSAPTDEENKDFSNVPVVEYAGGYFEPEYYTQDVNPVLNYETISSGSQQSYTESSGMTVTYSTGTSSTNGQAWVELAPTVQAAVKPSTTAAPAASYLSANTVSLYWSPAEVLGVGDVSSYNIYESTSSNFTNAKLVGTSTSPTFTVTGLSAETNYYIATSAVDTTGVSTIGNISPAITTTATNSDSGKSFSPFVDLTQSSVNIATMAQQSGVRDFTLAFENSAGLQSSQANTATQNDGNYANDGSVPTLSLGGATVEPNGVPVLNTGAIFSEVQQVETEGGTVTVAVGGYTGRDPAIIAAEYGAYLNNTSYSGFTADSNGDYAPTAGSAAAVGSTAWNTAVSNLQSEYQSAVSSTGAKAVTFDIENDSVPDEEWQYNSSGGYYHEVALNNGAVYKEDILATTSGSLDEAADTMRDAAILRLEQSNPNLSVSFTLAVNPTGLSTGSQPSSNPSGANANGGVDSGDNAEQLVREAKSAGVTLNSINIMAMDYSEDLNGNAWSVNTPNEGNLYNDSGSQTNMATAAEDAAQATENFLVASGMSSTKVQITVMPGNNDIQGEVFSTQDATALEQWAATKSWVSGLSEWSANRDAETSTSANSTSTGVTSTPYAFAGDFNTISKAYTVATMVANQSTLPNAFAVGDTEADIVNGIGSLQAEAAHITSINPTDTPVAVGIGKFTADQAALDLVNGGFSIAGMASAIEGDLSGIQADPNITSVGAVDGVISVGYGKFSADETALNKITAGFSIVGQSATISANFDALNADSSHINTMSFADANPVVSLTTAQYNNDASLIAKIAGNWTLDESNTDGSTTLTGHGAGLTINATANGGDTITGGGSGDTFVFQPNFGQDTVTDFANYLGGSTHDTISLSATEFGGSTSNSESQNFANVLNDTTYSNGNATITSPTGDHLVLQGVASSAVMQNANNNGDFKFS